MVRLRSPPCWLTPDDYANLSDLLYRVFSAIRPELFNELVVEATHQERWCPLSHLLIAAVAVALGRLLQY